MVEEQHVVYHDDKESIHAVKSSGFGIFQP